MTRFRCWLLLVALTAGGVASPSGQAAPVPGSSLRASAVAVATPMNRPPVLAYYYIWFNASSWNRAKQDWPTVGRYTSDEATVMRKHIRAARRAGIEGFLVSWKDTALLDERLAKLVEVARDEKFALGLVYQGLDVRREPLPVEKVLNDLKSFSARWGKDPVFDIFHKPLVVWTGTWRFSPADISRVSKAVRPGIQLLASERSAERWDAVGPLVDGDAYYWSSVDPHRDRHALERLKGIATAVHRTHGLWIAPAAPGFDARLIGGTRDVDRDNGETLKREWAMALATSPDAIGLISWNEFTEGTNVEPSTQYGDQALRTLAQLTGTPGPQGELDSSAPGGRSAAGPLRALVVLTLLGSLVLASFVRTRLSSRSPGGHLLPTSAER
ncbi:MAG TPA: hypothetical protein VM097_04165, partial [Mycobacteriales bacterium]|nr:hypothetical protein [Mycobacteriales bacterium]